MLGSAARATKRVCPLVDRQKASGERLPLTGKAISWDRLLGNLHVVVSGGL